MNQGSPVICAEVTAQWALEIAKEQFLQAGKFLET